MLNAGENRLKTRREGEQDRQVLGVTLSITHSFVYVSVLGLFGFGF